MDLIRAEQERIVRFYRWASDHFAWEIEQGYPSLREFPSDTIFTFLRLSEQMTTEEQTHFAQALLKDAHPKALQLTGEVQDVEDKSLVTGFRHEVGRTLATRSYQEFISGVNAQAEAGDYKLESAAFEKTNEVLRAILNDKYQDFNFALQLPQTKSLEPSINGKRLSRLVKEELFPLLGGKFKSHGGSEWYMPIEVGDWTVTMEIDFGYTCESKISLEYGFTRWDMEGLEASQLLWSNDLRKPQQHGITNFLMLLGIDGETAWEISTEEDLEALAHSIAAMHTRVMHALPPLLHGLSCSD